METVKIMGEGEEVKTKSEAQVEIQESGERAVEEKQSLKSGKEGSKKGSSSIDHDGGSSSASAGTKNDYAIRWKLKFFDKLQAVSSSLGISGCGATYVLAQDSKKSPLAKKI
ncbi:hypothetical protein POTOM_017756 [Populus tomentosa]|uniref:Uncharacterized protein n=1 Tax=Populus tomentosa TaxID=118781 RepID=A0A8X7ZXN8_POPTO|nr:hypothetical protein POTOM_017756 [Populus tomentosa]